MLGTALLGAACSSDDSTPEPITAIAGTHVLFDVAKDAPFYAAPFPRPNRARGDGSLSVADSPNPNGNVMVQQMVDMLTGSQGFSTNGAAYFLSPLPSTKRPCQAAWKRA